MRLELTKDAKGIAELFTHPDVLVDITNDECPDVDTNGMERIVSNAMPLSLYFKVLSKDNKLVGILSFHVEEEELTLDMHGAFLKGFRGRFSMNAIKEAINVVFKHTQYEKIWVRFSSNKLPLLRIASYLGFKLEYLSEQDYPDRGFVYDTICMTLIKKDYKHG